MWEKAARRLKPAGALTLVVAALCLAAIVLARSADQSDFMPHGFCYLWNSRKVWLCHFSLRTAQDRDSLS